VRKTFKYRLYPTKRQVEFLTGQLAEACRLYNGALQERRDAYRLKSESLTYYDQAKQLKGIRAASDLSLENFSCCQDVLRRVDKNFKAFFRRVKDKERPSWFPALPVSYALRQYHLPQLR
jgi:putative transposase